MCIVTLTLSLLMLSGCASMLTAISTADVVSALITGKTSTDNVVSVVAGEDCAVFRMFRGDPICKDKEVEVLREMDCKVYSWDEDNKPYCREEK